MGRHLKLLTATTPLCTFCLGVMAVGPPSGVTPVGIAKGNPASANPAQLAPSSQDRLLGKWEGITAGKTVFEMVFLKDGKGTFWEEDEKGRPQIQSFRYTADVEKVPHELDLTLGGDTALTIFEFTPDGRLHMAEPGERRPTNYDKETIVFRKAKPSAPAAATGSAVPQDPAHDSEIAYKDCKILGHKGSRGNYDIYVMNYDGSDLTNLTRTPYGFFEKYARWSPDGRKILYCTETSQRPTKEQSRYAGEIYVMDADGSNKRNLTKHPAKDHGALWSPDGKKILFISDRDGNREVYVMNADGSDQRNVSNSEANDADPCWSPDGTKIAFTSVVDKNSKIFISSSDGSNLRRLTRGPRPEKEISWSPAGAKIAFSSAVSSGNKEICTINADGSGLMRLTQNQGVNQAPSWSPDGSRIAFVSNIKDANAPKEDPANWFLQYKMYIMNADGSNVRKLTEVLPVGGILWSPDGRKIATTINEDLFLIDAEGQGPDNGDVMVSVGKNQYLVSPSGKGAERFPDKAMGDMSWSPLVFAKAVKAEKDGAKQTMGRQSGPLDSFPPRQWVDVLQHVDVSRDLVSGKWQKTGAGIDVAPGKGARLMLPVRVEGSYDLEVEFTRNKGDSDLAVLFPIGSGAGALCVGLKNRELGIGTIDGRWAGANLTTRQVRPFVNGQRYTVRIVVDAMMGGDATVEVFLDEQPCVLWLGKQSSVRLRDLWKLPETNRPALGTYDADVTFHIARLRVASGQASWLHTDRQRVQTPERSSLRRLDTLPAAQQMHAAAVRGDVGTAKALTKTRPGLVNELVSNGDHPTPLHVAVYHGHAAFVAWLLDQHADINAVNRLGVTPLHEASSQGNKEIVEMLLALKPPLNVKDRKGKTPLQYAVEAGHGEVARLLREAETAVTATAFPNKPDVARSATDRLREAPEPNQKIPADVQRLIDRLSDKTNKYRGEAALGLARKGQGAAAAIPVLLECLKDAGIQVNVLCALSTMELDPDQALDPLIAVLKDPEAEAGVLCKVADILARMGPAAQRALPALLALGKHSSAHVRMSAVSAVQGIAPQDLSLISLCVELLGDADHQICADAALALGGFGTAAKEAAPQLKKALSHDSDLVRLAAALALSDMDIEVPGAFEIWVSCMKHSDPVVRCNAAEWTRQVTADRKKVVPILRAALDDEDVYVRLVAAKSLIAFGAESEVVLPLLQKELSGNSRTDYGLIAETLAGMGKAALPLLPHLQRLSRETGFPADWQASLKDAVSQIEAASQTAVMHDKGAAPVPGNAQTRTIPGLGLELVLVQNGSFRMGSEDERNFAFPVHPVQITRSFWIGRHEVSQKAYEALTGTNPSHHKGEKNPVETVSWHDAVAFCKKLTDREKSAGRVPEGYEYRLPSEAEWEYAARGGAKGGDAKDYGPDHKRTFEWHMQNFGSKPHPVGVGPTNSLGLCGMTGNVEEWCLDWYQDWPNTPYANGLATDPVGPPTGKEKICKGGLSPTFDGFSPAAYRDPDPPGNTDDFLGFRVLLGPPLRPENPDPSEKLHPQEGGR